MNSIYVNLAAEIHISVKKKIINFLDSNNPSNLTLKQLQEFIECEIKDQVNNLYKTNDTLFGKTPYNFGLAFPIGLSLDNVVAHYTPVSLPQSILENIPAIFNEQSKLNNFSVIKIDYGIIIEGNIIDSAFTINLNNSELSTILIDSSREITKNICNSIGADQRLNDLADIANEIIDSYENPITNIPLKLVENVYSHNILPSQIHGGKFIRPDYKKYSDDWKVKAGELYAIEFYPTSGSGLAMLTPYTQVYSHYKLRDTCKKIPIFDTQSTNKIVTIINNNLNKVPFCPNFIDLHVKSIKHHKTIKTLQQLYSLNYLDSYPPIVESDPKGIVSQTEATVEIKDNETVNVVCGL